MNALRSARRRREQYVGNWLPEPVRTEPDAGSDLLLAESVSVAMLLVLETLGPDERAVFVLREVFGFGHTEIAASIGRSVAATRQIAHRAREHVHARRKRFDPPSESAREVAARFLAVSTTGDIQALMDMLAPDAVELSDGGGVVSAARRPIVGAEKIARFLGGLAARGLPDMRLEQSTFNVLPAMIVYSRGEIDLVMMIEVTGGKVSGVYLVRNPDKLVAVADTLPLAR